MIGHSAFRLAVDLLYRSAGQYNYGRFLRIEIVATLGAISMFLLVLLLLFRLHPFNECELRARALSEWRAPSSFFIVVDFTVRRRRSSWFGRQGGAWSSKWERERGCFEVGGCFVSFGLHRFSSAVLFWTSVLILLTWRPQLDVVPPIYRRGCQQLRRLNSKVRKKTRFNLSFLQERDKLK